jgi:hypothetical protein
LHFNDEVLGATSNSLAILKLKTFTLWILNGQKVNINEW